MIQALLLIIDYVNELMEEVVCIVNTAGFHSGISEKVPPPLSTQFDMPCKEDAVREHTSRFS